MKDKYPIFPEVNFQKATIREDFNSNQLTTVLRVSSLVRVYSGGKWYDLYLDEMYKLKPIELETQPEKEEWFKMLFMKQCVLHLTLWQGGSGDLTERFLSPRQEHHDPVVAEMFKKKQENEE